jgi:hypothetical protein
MTDASRVTSARSSARAARLAQALRDNLGRRKEQARARVKKPAAEGAEDAGLEEASPHDTRRSDEPPA